METIKIEILNPKAKNLLKSLVELNLIQIQNTKDSKNDFLQLVKELRDNSKNPLSLNEITEEVEAVRRSRND